MVTTVLVAWVAAIIEPTDKVAWRANRARIPENGEGEGQVELHLLHGFGFRWYAAAAFSTPLKVQDDVLTPEERCPSWARESLLPWCAGAEPWPLPHQDPSRYVLISGWPMPCLYKLYRTYETNEELASIQRAGWRQNAEGYAVCGGIPWNVPRLGGKNHLPLFPRWLALGANTAFYSVIWFALLFSPRMVRRALQRRRGVCPRCGYDLHGLPAGAACPECGETRPAIPP